MDTDILDTNTSSNEQFEATLFNADASNGRWNKAAESGHDQENKIIMDVVRKSLREKKHPQRTVYGVLVTNNFKTYKAYSTPFYATSPVSDYVLKYKNEKSQIVGTQTSCSSFQGSSTGTRSDGPSKGSSHKYKRSKTTQRRVVEEKSYRNYVPVKVERPATLKNVEKTDRYLYYYGPVLTRLRKNQLRRTKRPRQ